jgi:hypothetical protein
MNFIHRFLGEKYIAPRNSPAIHGNLRILGIIYRAGGCVSQSICADDQYSIRAATANIRHSALNLILLHANIAAPTPQLMRDREHSLT